MTKPVMLGVFMPVASNGFLASNNAPRYQPSFAHSLAIAETAEGLGLDYLFWMGKWRGFGGQTGLWDHTLEPITLASAIAARTSRLKLIATINPLLFHPAVAAKMISTVDDVSDGRFGINVVTGNTLDEVLQMGVVPEGYDAFRYDYAEEWTRVLKRLWTESSVTFSGQFFELTDCVSDPKPRQRPFPIIVNAGTSDEGLRYGARHSNYSFLGTRADAIEKAKAFAKAEGRELKFFSNVFIIARETDESAEAEFQKLHDGLDEQAMLNALSAFQKDGRMTIEARTSQMKTAKTVGYGAGAPVVGSAQTVARKLVHLIENVGLDGLQFTFVDFVEDLKAFGRDVLPLLNLLLRERGFYRPQ